MYHLAVLFLVTTMILSTLSLTRFLGPTKTCGPLKTAIWPTNVKLNPKKMSYDNLSLQPTKLNLRHETDTTKLLAKPSRSSTSSCETRSSRVPNVIMYFGASEQQLYLYLPTLLQHTMAQ